MQHHIKKLFDHGTDNPIVPRLSLQTWKLLEWSDLAKPEHDKVGLIYLDLVARLLHCYDLAKGIHDKCIAAGAEFNPQNPAMIPQVMSLRPDADNFLYEAKNYLRELLGVVQVFFGKEFKEASAFYNPKGGSSDLVKWATATFGPEDALTRMLAAYEAPLGEIIKKRNAVEHPGGHSGTLTVENIASVNGVLIQPQWKRNDDPLTDVLGDMNSTIRGLLILAEDILGYSIERTSSKMQLVGIVEIPEEKRNPVIPIRLEIQLRQSLPPDNTTS